jgi:general secretion pathway protein M
VTLDPTSRQSRILAVALLLGLLIAIWLAVIEPTAGAFAEQSAALARSAELLQAFKRGEAAVPNLKVQLDELHKRQLSEMGFLEGTNTAMGSAALQAATKRMLEAAGGVLRSIQVLPSATEGAAQRVGVRIDGTVPSGRLLDFLYSVRTAVPYMFLDDLEIRVPETSPGLKTTQDPALRADIYGYIRTAAR